MTDILLMIIIGMVAMLGLANLYKVVLRRRKEAERKRTMENMKSFAAAMLKLDDDLDKRD